jgi:hypothetical protein
VPVRATVRIITVALALSAVVVVGVVIFVRRRL